VGCEGRKYLHWLARFWGEWANALPKRKWDMLAQLCNKKKRSVSARQAGERGWEGMAGGRGGGTRGVGERVGELERKRSWAPALMICSVSVSAWDVAYVMHPSYPLSTSFGPDIAVEIGSEPAVLFKLNLTQT